MILTITANPSIDRTYLVKDVRLNVVQRVSECVSVAGGKGLNVTKVINKLGGKVVSTGFLGGYSGQFIKNKLNETNIENKFIDVNSETRNCINIIDIDTKKSTEFLEPGGLVTQTEQEKFFELLQGLKEQIDIVTMSGSLCKGLSQDFYIRVIEFCNKNNIKTILDSSGNLLKQSIYAKPYMIKPNIDELLQISGKAKVNEQDIIDIGTDLLAKGVKIVVVSLGGDGSMIFYDDKIKKIAPPKVDVISTVGCGDSFVAGFAFGLDNNKSIDECIKIATAVSAANAMKKETGDFNISDYNNLYSQLENKIINIR